MITVGSSKIKDPNTHNERICKYSDIPKDPNGWVLDSDYKPIPFDLMYLRLRGHTKTKTGWWSGRIWTGLRLKRSEKVVCWKRNQEYERF